MDRSGNQATPLTTDELRLIFEAVNAGKEQDEARHSLSQRNRITVNRTYNVVAEFKRRGITTLDDRTAKEIAEAAKYSATVSYVQNLFLRWCAWRDQNLSASSRGPEAKGEYLNWNTVQRDKHIEELLALANEIRKYLTVPFPFEATAWYNQIGVQVTGWQLPGLPCPSIEGFTLSEEQQALIPSLKAHLDDPGFWKDLEALNEDAIRYCYDLHNWIELMVADARDATGLPLLKPGQEGMAGFTEAFFDKALSLSLAMDKEDPEGSLKLAKYYQPGAKIGDLTALTYGHKSFTVIAWMPEDDNEQLIELHGTFALKMSGQFIRELVDSHAKVETALERLRSRLMPAVIRFKIVRGRCDLCP